MNEPPESTQLSSMPFSSCAIASGSSSSTETSWPSPSIFRAMDEPTRPEPTIITNTERTLTARAARSYGATPSRTPSSPAGGAVSTTRQGAFSST